MGFAYLVYRFQQEADNIWPNGVRQWRNFLDGRLVSKPPQFLLDFLQFMREYPTYSVDGIKGKIWSKYKIYI